MPPTLSFCLHQLWSRTLSETQLPSLGKKRKERQAHRKMRKRKYKKEERIGGRAAIKVERKMGRGGKERRGKEREERIEQRDEKEKRGKVRR